MTRTYNDYANLTRSSKAVLCHIQPKQRLSVFSNVSGSIYKKSVNYVVIDVKEDGTSLTEALSSSLSSGEWFYDHLTSELYVNVTDDLDPKTHKIIVTYRLFYADRPMDLPYDLSSGFEVHYEGRLTSNSPVKRQLDDEQIGIVLETSSNIKLENTDAALDEIYDVLIFENSDVFIYSWSELIPLSEKRKLFSGIIENKKFSEKDVTFTCKDGVYKLRKPISTATFSFSDGSVPERFLNKPKRIVYGRHDQLQCVPIDSILDGYTLTGTVSGTSGSPTLTGTGTAFLDECSPEDDLFFDDGNQVYRFGIASVDSDTQITLNDDLEVNVSGSLTNNPKIPWRKKNRNWHIAGHKLRAPSTTVEIATSARRFQVVDGTDFLDGDLISLDGTNVFISSITGNFVTLSAAFQAGIPALGATVTKNPLRRAFLDGREVFIDRDWDVSNTSSDAILQLNELSEFNIAQAVAISLTCDFTNGSRSININGADFTPQLQPRDWIRSNDISHTTWYEVLSVTYDDATNDTTVLIRTPYAGSTRSSAAQKKNVSIVDDRSVITVNCIGKEDASGKWIKTASDAVKELIESDLSLTNINTSSFLEAKSDAPYVLSYKIPERIGGKVKSIRDVISDINKSVFGSLTIDGDQNFKYEVLSPKKPADAITLKDDDVVSVNYSNSRSKIIRKVNANYRFYADKYTGDSSSLLYEYSNDFVDDLIAATDELDLDLFLYELKDATAIAQRYAFFNSLSQAKISIRGKLNLELLNLNDKINMNFDRLYRRFGGLTRQKTGIINKITKDGKNAIIEVNDLGGIFNRVANISANTANTYGSATDEEKLVNGYIVDNDTLTPDTSDDSTIYQNLIG